MAQPVPDVLLHIPHSSIEIPSRYRSSYLLEDDELEREVLTMTDLYTDHLYRHEDAFRHVFPVSRLLVDVERFRSDELEPMASRGMGATYVRTHDNRILREDFDREHLLATYYDPHHAALEAWANAAFEAHGRALIVDCHSFPSQPLPCDMNRAPGRPAFCVGTDPFHTPRPVRDAVLQKAADVGWTIGVNVPFAGTIVPLSKIGADVRVSSVMLEINRAMYMNEATGERSEGYPRTAELLVEMIEVVVRAWRQA